MTKILTDIYQLNTKENNKQKFHLRIQMNSPVLTYNDKDKKSFRYHRSTFCQMMSTEIHHTFLSTQTKTETI